MTTLHESLTGTMDDAQKYGGGAPQKIGAGHVVYHESDARVAALVAIGQKRLADGRLIQGDAPLLEVLSDADVLAYVEAAIRGFKPNPAEIDKGHVERAAISLELLDPHVRALYLKLRGRAAANRLAAGSMGHSLDERESEPTDDMPTHKELDAAYGQGAEAFGAGVTQNPYDVEKPSAGQVGMAAEWKAGFAKAKAKAGDGTPKPAGKRK